MVANLCFCLEECKKDGRYQTIYGNSMSNPVNENINFFFSRYSTYTLNKELGKRSNAKEIFQNQSRITGNFVHFALLKRRIFDSSNSAVTDGKKMYIFGGKTLEKHSLNDLWEFDIGKFVSLFSLQFQLYLLIDMSPKKRQLGANL